MGDIDFKSIQIGLASKEKILDWSYGEVKKPETINYRTSKPEKDGLFCEKIFGPTKDYECYCGKYKQIRYKGVICDRCGVELTKSKVRRERMGHIALAAPVTHIWYFKGIPSRIGLLLEMSPKELERIIYFAAYVVTDPGNTPLDEKTVLTENEYKEYRQIYGSEFTAKIGAEAIQDLLGQVDLEKESQELKQIIATETTRQKKTKAIKKLKIVEDFRNSNNNPQDMVLEVVPVIPPELRPMVMLDGGRYATSDLNDLYRRVINRNNRLKRLLELNAPDIIVQNEKRMLQEAVDALIDNGRRGRPVTGPGNRPLRSLSDMLKGKQGRFRQNLLGKRVDYSGRSVIVVGPELKMYQCGLPKEMAIELFKPFIMRELVKRKHSLNIKSAKRMVERQSPEVWDVLDDVIKDHPVLLNRAPTLHRLGIQAFEPILVEGRAIKLHPLVCTAFNADFDGDQMAVHVPLSVEAQAEARFLMLAAYNILKPQDGSPVVSPTQDMILGSYYLTIVKENQKGEGKAFASIPELEMAYYNKEVELHAKVKVRVKKVIDGKEHVKIVESTVGRFLFNQIIPQDLGFVVRETPADMFKLEIDKVVDKGVLSEIVYKCFTRHGAAKTSMVLDDIKKMGFTYSTKAAVTVSISDMEVPDVKPQLLDEADVKVDKVLKKYKRGMITEAERKREVIDIWNDTTNLVTNALLDHLDPFNPINMMADSGARGSRNQIRQLAGMRGLMASPNGDIIELPIRSNFREGLDVLEFFISSHGARKGLADTALRTADSGYLTRRLVDVSQDQIVKEDDCGTDQGYDVTAIKVGNDVIEELEERINGRYAFDDVVNPNTGEVIVSRNELITPDKAKKIVDAGIEKVSIRAVFNCKSKVGVCAKCYGVDLTSMKTVSVGEAVGTIAAQSIGEPGTQLTMRTFHTGGVASAEDITQGLPRIEELFEARRPKGQAIISDIDGVIEVTEEDGHSKVIVMNNENGEVFDYDIPYGSRIKVRQGDKVEAGDEITEGSIYPEDLLRIKGVDGVQKYILTEVQKVYRYQGVHISDKHVEIIIRQMLRKYEVTDAGETELLPGTSVDYFEFENANQKAREEGKEEATGNRKLLGITKASLSTSSFLSAASFQETTKVLTDAAIQGKVDPLLGLKENIILGKLIPAGTGIKKYDLELVKNKDDDDLLKEILDELNESQIENSLEEEGLTVHDIEEDDKLDNEDLNDFELKSENE
ncbi:DNA-directed RNA polymerase subunit beta' [Anaerofustis stercorihominis]|uniref:DNA-directed RNA polymerase subunit beta' n=1 Tax=Anaerofustis stercorihominis TaxID=214853 RepID=UPI00214CB863|nr:DNA-directed RNA polymerase subunit beta' [Anaerofustis stercorihominis]MCR2033439.1 DNA-directed RNA polymerase subunit beta' [Anaerofustis stercorihominis]